MPESDEQGGRGKGIRSAAQKLRKASEDALKKASENIEEVQDAAQQRLKSTAESTRSAAQSLTERAISGVDAAQDVAQQGIEAARTAPARVVSESMSATGNAIGAAADVAKSVGTAITDLLFVEVVVPAFLLPTGPRVDDYALVFDLNEVFARLETGVLVRPSIEIWAADDGMRDYDLLAEQLKNSFVFQYEDTQQRVVASRETELVDIDTRLDELSTELDREGRKTRKSLAGWALLLVLGDPLVLLALWMGRTPRLNVLGLMKQKDELQRDKRRVEKELESELKRLEGQFRRNGTEFRRAVQQIKIRPHPHIAELARVINVIEGIKNPAVAATPMVEDALNILPYVRSKYYGKWVPERLKEPIANWVESTSIELAGADARSDLGSLQFLPSE